MALSLERYREIWPWTRESKLSIILKKRIQRARKKSPEVVRMKTIINSFPDDLLMEIFSWLPVKTLLQFRVVCKSWNAIIKSPEFISKHLKNYYSFIDDCSDCLIAQYAITQAGELEVREFLLDDKAQKVLASTEIGTPEYNTFMCGPCNGIYYLWRFYNNDGRYLWNPALNELKPLPQLMTKPNLPSSITVAPDFYGFGYDPLTNDYKVIVIKGYWQDASNDVFDDNRTFFPLSIFIYSLRNDSWRYWGDLTKSYYLERNPCYILVNQSFYWLAVAKHFGHCDFDMLISFNLTTEVYQELQLPDYEKPASSSLAQHYDSLAFIVVDDEKKCFFMWTLDEGGLWTLKYSMILGFEHFCSPLGHWKDNKLLFWLDDNLVVYDLVTQEKWTLNDRMCGYRRCENISEYKESLVSVRDRKMWKKHEES